MMRYKNYRIEELRILPAAIDPLISPDQVRQDFAPWQYSGWEGKNQLFKLMGKYIVEFKFFNSPVIHKIVYTPQVLIDFGSIPRFVPRSVASVFGWAIQCAGFVTHDLGYRLQPYNRKFWDFVLRAILEYSEAEAPEQFIISRSVRVGGRKYWNKNAKYINDIRDRNALVYQENDKWSIDINHPRSIVRPIEESV